MDESELRHEPARRAERQIQIYVLHATRNIKIEEETHTDKKGKFLSRNLDVQSARSRFLRIRLSRASAVSLRYLAASGNFTSSD